MPLIDQIDSDIITALKSHDEIRVGVLRLLKNALKNSQIDAQKELLPEEEVSVIRKQIKDREETISLYRANGKDAAIIQEEKELAILKPYLPADMPDDQVMKYIDEAIVEVKPTSINDFGKVMANLIPKLKGKVDGSHLAKLIKQALS